MSARVSRSFPLPSPLKMVEECSSMAVEKQGIVTILGGSDTQLNKAASLRRTLSADMSSKKWLAQNGFFSPMKRIALSEELAIPDRNSSEEEGEEEERLDMPGQDDIWRLIQSKEEKKEVEKPSQLNNAWSSILAEKSSNDTNNLPPPYVHPLVKRTGSALSEKSLEICTESLGSETGSDGCFPSYPPSESGEYEEDKEEATQQQQRQEKEPEGQESFEELPVAKYNCNPSKRMTPKTFPPPLPSLTRGNGPSVHMHSHRKNGRLVLEAISVAEKNYFRAQRQEGRLLLSLINDPSSQEPRQEEMENEVGRFDEVFGDLDEVFDEVEKNEAVVDGDEYDYSEEEEEEEDERKEQREDQMDKQLGLKDMTFMIDHASSLPSGVINVQGSKLLMKRLMRMDNKDSTWSNKLNKAVNLMEEEVMEALTPIPQSLPPQPGVARMVSPPSPITTVTSSFNTYEYFWRNKPSVTTIISPVTQQSATRNKDKTVLSKISSIKKAYEQQDLVLIRGCKDSRKSLLIWQPNCIATS